MDFCFICLLREFGHFLRKYSFTMFTILWFLNKYFFIQICKLCRQCLHKDEDQQNGKTHKVIMWDKTSKHSWIHTTFNSINFILNQIGWSKTLNHNSICYHLLKVKSASCWFVLNLIYLSCEWFLEFSLNIYIYMENFSDFRRFWQTFRLFWEGCIYIFYWS